MKVRTLLLLPVLVAACGDPSPGQLDAAIADCRVRARASAGEYGPSFQVCLVDRAHLADGLAAALADAETALDDFGDEANPKIRWLYFQQYQGAMRMAVLRGADTAWARERVRRDSLIRVQVYGGPGANR